MVQPVVDSLGNVLGHTVFDRLFRRWDGKNLSSEGTISCSFKLLSGSEAGLTNRWRGYLTGVSECHLWIGRHSVHLTEVHVHQRRPPRARDLLDPDFVIIPAVTASGARIEWALRASQVGEVVKRLSVVVD